MAIQQEWLSHDKVTVVCIFYYRLDQSTASSRIHFLIVDIEYSNCAVDPAGCNFGGVAVFAAGCDLQADNLITVQGFSRSHATTELFALGNFDSGISST